MIRRLAFDEPGHLIVINSAPAAQGYKSTMSILRGQVRACLAALLVAGLLLVSAAAGLAAPASCTDGELHGVPASSSQLIGPGHVDVLPLADAQQPLAGCCSAAASGCCVGTAVMFDATVEPTEPFSGATWPLAARSDPGGLGQQVNPHPPRLV